ncbi:MAG: hypothetical protein KAJ92_01625 [Gammaproteobacteria bacterium]|nr:hypothetical protein [Gammaproteobacteria bacterium]MCK5262347.1 hypothetical protein [Gammaproteobacteria bacterium]
MSEPLFNIVFFGILQPGKDKDTAMQNMAKLFKTEPAELTPFFAGGRKVIKSNVDELVAEKYRVALENAGLVIKIEEAAEAAPTQPLTASAQQASKADTGGITIAEVGANVIENPVEVPPQKIDDISNISMAEVGADVLENPPEVVAQEIDDISSISMAEVGANVIEHPVEVTPASIADISDISMAEAGADIVENPKEKDKAPIPDISELSLK